MNDWPDDVKRVHNAMNIHTVAGAFGWCTFSMADGSALDNVAYPTWNEAVKAAKWDRDNYFFIEIQPDGMSYGEADAVLKYARTLSKAGYRIPSPDWEAGPMVSSMPAQPHDRKRMIKQLIAGKPIIPEGIPYGNLPNAFRRVN